MLRVIDISGNLKVKGIGGGAGATGSISAGTTNATLGQVVFSNSNGVSFGLNGQTMTASVGGAAAGSISAGTTNVALGEVVFSNANGVSFGLNGSTITGTVATNYQSQGAYLTTAMLSNAVTLSNIKLSAGTLSALRSDITFNNSNGVSFGLETNGFITATVKTDYQTSGNYLTTAMASDAGSNFMGTNTALTANGVSMTANSSGLSLNFPAFLTTAQPVGAYLTTAAQSNQVVNSLNGSTGQISLNVGSSLSASTNGSSITFGLASNITTALQSAGAYLTTARASNDGVGLNTAQTNVTWTVNSSGISLNAGGYAGTGTSATNASITLNSNGLAISVAAPGGGGLTNINVSAGTTSNLLSALTFANGGGVSFGLNASTITATVATNYQSQGAYLTTAMASNRGSDFMGTNTALTANGVSMTANSSGLSLNFPAFLTTAALSNHSHNFATTTTNGALIVVGTTNSAGATIGVPAFLTTAQAPGAYLTTARASNDAIGLNTAQTNVTWTVNSSGLSLNAAGYAGTGTTFNGANISGSITQNSNGINLSMSVAAPGGGGAINVSAGTTSGNLQTVVFSNSNGVSFGLDGSTVTASVNAGGGGLTRSYFDNLGPLNTISGALGTKLAQVNQVQIFPLKPYQDLFNGSMTINTMVLEASVSGSTATLSAAGISTIFRFGLYTLVTTGASMSLGLINSFGKTIGVAGAATNNSVSWNGQRLISVHSSEWSSQPVLSDNVHYFCGLHISSVGSSAQTFAMMGAFAGSTTGRSGYLGAASSNATWNGNFGPFLGVYGTTTAALPTDINYTQVNKQSASANFIPHIVGYNYTNMSL